MGKEKKSVMGIARPVNMTRYPQNTGSTMPFGTFSREVEGIIILSRKKYSIGSMHGIDSIARPLQWGLKLQNNTQQRKME